MRIIKPPRLKAGDVIGICAPASAPDTEERIDRGIRYLERLGYRVEPGKHIYRKRGYLAGTDAERAADVNALFTNPKVKAIFTVRGGYGSHRILPLLRYEAIKRYPKILVGYSDITALQLALLSKTGLVSFSGPMVASDFAAGFRGNAEERFWQLLTSTKRPPPLKARVQTGVSATKSSIGRMVGGNLSLVSALVGTPYFPAFHDIILLLEEIAERPYRIDRQFQQMKLAGLFDRVSGIALGKFIDCGPDPGKPSLSLDQIFRETFRPLRVPVLTHLQYGHVANPQTIPLGISVRLNAKAKRVEFLESAVI